MNLAALTERFVRAAALVAGLLVVSSPVYAHETESTTTTALASTEQIWNQPAGYGQESLVHLQRCAEDLCAELNLQTVLLERITQSTAPHVFSYLNGLLAVLPNDTAVEYLKSLASHGELSALAGELSSLHLRLIGARGVYMDSIVDYQEWLITARLVTPGDRLAIPARFVRVRTTKEPVQLDLEALALTLRLSDDFGATRFRKVRNAHH